MKRWTSALWLLIPILLSPLHYAHAYIDPGTGSYAIQIVIGVLFGTTYAVKSFGGRLITRVKERYRRK